MDIQYIYISTLFKDIWTQIKLYGYLCFEYQHEIILVSDIYTSILLVDIYNLDIYFLKIFEHAKIVHG